MSKDAFGAAVLGKHSEEVCGELDAVLLAQRTAALAVAVQEAQDPGQALADVPAGTLAALLEAGSNPHPADPNPSHRPGSPASRSALRGKR
jgi:hypothetical protein